MIRTLKTKWTEETQEKKRERQNFAKKMRGFPRGITKVDDKTSADLKSDQTFEKAL